MPADAGTWIALGLLAWVAGVVVLIALAGAARRGDEQLDRHARAVRRGAAARSQPVSASALLADACAALGARRAVLLAHRGDARELVVVARHDARADDAAQDDTAAALGAEALAVGGIVVAHAETATAATPRDPEQAWSVRAVAVPVGDGNGNRGALCLDAFAPGRTLGAADQRRLSVLAASAAPFLGSRFTRPGAPRVPGAGDAARATAAEPGPRGRR